MRRSLRFLDAWLDGAGGRPAAPIKARTLSKPATRRKAGKRAAGPEEKRGSNRNPFSPFFTFPLGLSSQPHIRVESAAVSPSPLSFMNYCRLLPGLLFFTSVLATPQHLSAA